MKIELVTRFVCEHCEKRSESVVRVMYMYEVFADGLRALRSPDFTLIDGCGSPAEESWSKVREVPWGKQLAPERLSDGTIMVRVDAGSGENSYYVCAGCTAKLLTV